MGIVKKDFLEKKFKLKENNANIRTEIVAGTTTFMTMAYILIVNPNILSEAGMDWGGVFTATIVASVIGTLAMAFLANYPFVLAPGMGLNAFFTYSVVLGMEKPWQYALTAVLIEGIIFIILSFFKVREAIFNAIPMNLKKAVSVGIGLFIALIGLINAGIVVADEGTIVALGNITDSGPLLALIGIIIIGLLYAKDVKGALLIGILLTTIIGIPMGVTQLPQGIIQAPPSLSKVAFQFQWKEIFTFDMLLIVFTFMFVDVFDTVGTLVGVSSKAGMLDKDGKLPRASQALLADAIGTTIGACLGTSTVTTFVESASGVSEGGRTGLTSLTAAILFLLALFLSPIFAIIPSQATAPALILVGLAMMSSVGEIDFNSDYTEAIPAFLTIVMMPFSYSIAEGIVFGMVSYVILKLISGKRKDISVVMYILAILFILKEVLPFIMT
ncbi:NCS2 family permease [Garciella nitratireducens]|uniref:Putative MFS transporter, AGZA family, xanthine/uracil permease n=1 Tax=Garciella nitratireducens DSM 15102 TaxID=1121911 RepID=A0A1T4MWR8_9FIRM|nr:NCS2 family permease [Garciella nitratireducens]SJZ71361.1 putative MFS transporter, AGZA family, xanthine/uracil permease [Garciella nitratireducens DSM 15102]